MWITDWTARAACRNADPDALFVQGAAQNRAKLICRGCPVRTECLADALDNRIEFGVWGGMTERERRGLLRRRVDGVSRREMLGNGRGQYRARSDDTGAHQPSGLLRDRGWPTAGQRSAWARGQGSARGADCGRAGAVPRSTTPHAARPAQAPRSPETPCRVPAAAGRCTRPAP